MKSIRHHLTLLLLLGLGTLCAAGGWFAYRAVRQTILAEFNYSLLTKVRNFSRLTEIEHGQHEFEFVDRKMPEFERAEHPEYYQIKSEAGEVLARSPSLGNVLMADPANPVSDEPQVYTLHLPGGLPGRAAVMEVLPTIKEEHRDRDQENNLLKQKITIILARDTARLDKMLRGLAMGFPTGTIAVLLLMFLAIKHIVPAGLRPLNELAACATSIQPANLDVRFPTSSMPTELRPIAEQLNQLLARIEAAFQRERYMTAAMAHELYTPISELRSLAEVAIKWPDDPEAKASVAEHAHGIALQMQDIVNALLSLSRCEAGLQKIRHESVDLPELLNAIRGSFDEQLRSKEIHLSWEIDSAGRVESDREMLVSMMTNLIKNAVEYTPRHGSLICRAERSDVGVSLVLANTHSDLSDDDLPLLFEPLWRKDKARTGSSHSGLGLAVVERFSRLLGIELAAALTESGLLEITMSLPSKPPAQQPPNSQ